MLRPVFVGRLGDSRIESAIATAAETTYVQDAAFLSLGFLVFRSGGFLFVFSSKIFGFLNIWILELFGLMDFSNL